MCCFDLEEPEESWILLLEHTRFSINCDRSKSPRTPTYACLPAISRAKRHARTLPNVHAKTTAFLRPAKRAKSTPVHLKTKALSHQHAPRSTTTRPRPRPRPHPPQVIGPVTTTPRRPPPNLAAPSRPSLRCIISPSACQQHPNVYAQHRSRITICTSYREPVSSGTLLTSRNYLYTIRIILHLLFDRMFVVPNNVHAASRGKLD